MRQIYGFIPLKPSAHRRILFMGNITARKHISTRTSFRRNEAHTQKSDSGQHKRRADKEVVSLSAHQFNRATCRLKQVRHRLRG